MATAAENILGIVLAAAALLTAVGYLVKRARAAVRTLDAIERILGRELDHNHGSSMKDDIGGIAVAVGHLQRQVGELESGQDDLMTRFNDHLQHREKP